MTRDPNNDHFQIEDYLGALDPAERPEMPGTRPDRADQIREAEELLAELAILAPVAEPPEGLFAAIEAEIDSLPSMRIQTLRADEGTWMKQTDKIWKKILSSDSQSGRSIFLLRCAPGAVVPPHQHSHEETMFVIEGEVWVGDSLLNAGDFEIAHAGSNHPETRSATGCLVLMHA